MMAEVLIVRTESCCYTSLLVICSIDFERGLELEGFGQESSIEFGRFRRPASKDNDAQFIPHRWQWFPTQPAA
jgi:hypothetical protein